MPHYTCITIYNMFLGISYFLLFSVSWINTESTPVFTEFNRNQLLLEFPLNCIGGFLSSEVKCVMTAFEENKGIAIFNNKSLACQTCNEVIDGSYVPQVGDVAWKIVRPWMPPWSQPDTVNTSLQPSFYVSFDSTVDFPLADVRLSTRNGKEGKGIYFPGEEGALVEAASTEMYHRNPEKFNWMYPGVSPKGLSFAIWINAENHTTVTGFSGVLTTTTRTVINGIYHSNMGIRVIFTQTGWVVFWLFVNDSVVTENFFARREENLSHNTWYHIGLTFSLENGMKVYRDGKKVASAAVGVDHIQFKTHGFGPLGKLQIGVSQIDKMSSEYKGLMDEFVAFNEELQEDDIKTITAN